mgnify:CR=1 FL=1
MKNIIEETFDEWLFGDDKGYNPFLRGIAKAFGGAGDGRTAEFEREQELVDLTDEMPSCDGK